MKRLLAVLLALVMGLLPMSSLAVLVPDSDCDLNITLPDKEDIEGLFDPDNYKDLWGDLENNWELPETSWEDIINLWDAFEDLDPAKWYWNGVEFCLESGLMQGLKAGFFGPDETTTRAQLVTILWRLDGSPYQTDCCDMPFEDVSPWSWYGQAVCWAYHNEIAAGCSEDIFAPNDPITREQLVTMLYRYAQMKGYDTTGSLLSSVLMKYTYTDYDEISEWALDPMRWAVGAKIISGTELFKLSPGADATRAQIATIFYNFCNVSVDEIE